MIMLPRVDVQLPFNSFRSGSPIQKDIAAFLSVIFARSFPSSHTGFLLLPPRLQCSHSLLPSAGHVRSVWEPKSMESYFKLQESIRATSGCGKIRPSKFRHPFFHSRSQAQASDTPSCLSVITLDIETTNSYSSHQ